MNGFCQKTIVTAQKTIVLDPGHGGLDTGIDAGPELFEKDIVLRLALSIAGLLDGKYNVLLSRSDDTELSVEKRISTANAADADLFVSLHMAARHGGTYFFHYLSAPDAPVGAQSGSPMWERQHIAYHNQSKSAAAHFKTQFSRQLPGKTFLSLSSPTLILQGARMPAVLIEPLSAADIVEDRRPLEENLDSWALLIARSIQAILDDVP